MFLKIMACLVMAFIAYQDFKYRAVHWLLLVALAFFIIADGTATIPIRMYSIDVLFNILLIIIQFLILFLFYVFRNKDKVFIINKVIGSADLIFIAVLAFAFSCESFLFFYLGGLLFTVILWLLVKNLFHTKSTLIPFAGIMALFYSALIIAEIIWPGFSRFNADVFNMFIYA